MENFKQQTWQVCFNLSSIAAQLSDDPIDRWQLHLFRSNQRGCGADQPEARKAFFPWGQDRQGNEQHTLVNDDPGSNVACLQYYQQVVWQLKGAETGLQLVLLRTDYPDPPQEAVRQPGRRESSRLDRL
jgi:hypothetical protein